MSGAKVIVPATFKKLKVRRTNLNFFNNEISTFTFDIKNKAIRNEIQLIFTISGTTERVKVEGKFQL